MRFPDELALFMDYYEAHGPTKKLRKDLIDLLSQHYPIQAVGINKVRCSWHIEDHHEYMRMAALLGKAGYVKQGIWFIYGGRK